MIVDCDSCTVRGDACGDCVITVLLGPPPGKVELDGPERRALDALAAAGMVPRLQLVDHHDDTQADAGAQGQLAGLEASEAEVRTPVQGRRAERSVGHVERSRRQVG